MAQYKALKSFYSESQTRNLEPGEIILVTDEQLEKDLDESIKKHGDGFFLKLSDDAKPSEQVILEKPKRGPKKKEVGE